MKWKLSLVAMVAALPAMAQQYTTAQEVKPIVSAIKSNWVAVREYNGQDLLYFTNLLAWRCGIDAIYYSVNGEAEHPYDAEPCYLDTAAPNAQKAQDYLPFVTLPPVSVDTISIRVVYGDGSEERAKFQRNSILMP